MMEVLLDTTAFNEISIKKETCLHIKVASSNNSNNSDSTLDTTISPCDIERKDDIVDTPFDDALNSPTEEICSQPVLNEEIFNKKIEISPVYAEALTTFTPIQENEYKRGASGKLPKDFMPCCCKFDEGKDDAGLACGEESDCINRALLIECTDDDCPLRSACQNRRFQNKEYAPIEVIKTEKKGYGIRAMENLRSNEFVIEYCGEVIPQSNFVKRTKEYSKSGVKHFYFMSLNGDDLIDAQKKGNISRFLNHSCAPNCMIQKWVVNSRMRMGIFTLRKIAAGEELTFDYKFDRYGKEAQPCYCGEPNCNGFIGGGNKTADSDDDEEEDVVEMDAKKPKRPKKEAKVKALENIEHVKTLVKKMLYSTKLPSQVTKLLRRLEVTDNLAMRKCFVKFHGLLVLKSCLTLYSRTDLSLCYQ
ncbi:histone methyltransferase set2, partial [Clydaea vesicula]